MTKEKPRFFIPNEKIFNGKFSLEDAADIHKIRSVLRLEPEDMIDLIADSGDIYQAEIERLEKSHITGFIKSKVGAAKSIDNAKQNKPVIILAQALPKSPKMDDIIRMNTEIGVKEFIPFESDYSIIKLKDFNPKKLDRWGKIAKEAARQSEQLSIPEINTPMSFTEVLKTEADHKLLLHSRIIDNTINISEVKKTITTGSTTLVIIGPEGGFSPREIDLARDQGCKIIHLDMPILRTETAGVVVNSIVLF